MERPKKTAVAGLPDDLLVEILSRLPINEIHRCKCVSKGWRDLIADPLHHKKLPQTLHGFFPSYVGELGSFINLSGGSASTFDPSFAFLKKLPGIHNIWLRASCNGLLLFRHSTRLRELGYIVFNPATEQWAAVPSEHTLADRPIRFSHTCFVFNPAVSPYFHLVIISARGVSLATVQFYSSETGVWRHTQIDWAEEVELRRQWNKRDPQIRGCTPCAAIFNSMLYLILTDNQIFEVDVEGNTKRIIRAPSSVGGRVHGCVPLFIGQSQGRLYCINEEHWADGIPSELSSRVFRRDSDDNSNLLSIWVLEDYDTQKWALKHSVSCSRLFGRTGFLGYNVVAIHPDNNNFMFIVYRKHQLISYGLNSKEVRTVGTFQESLQLPPYVPCFSDFLSVARHEEILGVGV